MIHHDNNFFKNLYWKREFSCLCFSKTGCSESIKQLWRSCLTIQKYLMDLWGMACLYKSYVDFHWPIDRLNYLLHTDTIPHWKHYCCNSRPDQLYCCLAESWKHPRVEFLPPLQIRVAELHHTPPEKKKCVLMANLSFLSAIWQPLFLPFITVPLLTFHHCQQEFDSIIYRSSSSSLIFGDSPSLTILTTGANCSEVESSILSRA